MTDRGVTGWSVSTIKWGKRNPDGSRVSMLDGDPKSAGLFTFALSIPAGFHGKLHRHSGDMVATVLKGVLVLGGPKGRTLHRTGSCVLVRAGAVHYDAARTETVVVIAGIGPLTTEYLDAEA